MKRTYYFIVNPASGRGKHLSVLTDIESFCGTHGLPFEIMVTKKPKDATIQALRVPRGNIIVAVGGDGTVHEVANGIIGSESILGIIPMGTSNDFAWQCGYTSNLRENLDIVRKSQTLTIDVGRLNGKTYVINAMSVGFDALVTKRAQKLSSYVGGFLSYFLTAIALLPSYTYSHMKLEINGHAEERERDMLLVVCANGKRYGGGFMIAPDARMQDSLLDIVSVRKAGWLYLLLKMPKLVRGTHEALPEVLIGQAQRMRLTVSRPIEAQIDGELIPADTTFDVQIVNKALQVIVQNNRAGI